MCLCCTCLGFWFPNLLPLCRNIHPWIAGLWISEHLGSAQDLLGLQAGTVLSLHPPSKTDSKMCVVPVGTALAAQEIGEQGNGRGAACLGVPLL